MAASLLLGITAIRRRDIAAHRAWMIRAYAIGLAAGTQTFTEGIGGALVGTFLGVFLSYGFVGPVASRLSQTYAQDGQFYAIIRDCLVAYLQGHSAPIAVELARGNVPTILQPSFRELDEVLGKLPADPLAA